MKKTNYYIRLLVTVVMLAILSVAAFAAVEDTGFSDVDADAWYAEAVAYCADNGLMSGTGQNEFSPDGTMTRAMFASILYRASGSPDIIRENTFSDVDNDTWYTDGIIWAADTGIISGYGDGIFGANDSVTREQSAAILWRFLDIPDSDNGSLNYGDAGDISSWAIKAVAWAVENDVLIPRQGNLLNPTSGATRGEIALALMRSLSEGNSPMPPVTELPEGDEHAVATTPPVIEDTNGGKVLIAYFTRTNTTKGVADAIHEITGGDLIEIETVNAYSNNYNEVLEQARNELAQNYRPALSTAITDIDDYDVIFVGYPIWHGTAPMAIFTFLESYDLSGKTVVPFSTSGSSGISRSVSEIRDTCNGSAVLEGLGLTGTSASSPQQPVEIWLNDLPLSLD